MTSDATRPSHRGEESIADFAPKFVEGRLVGFEKDMRICLTSIELPGSKKKTVAYFPALAACCSTLEYFVALHRGNLNPAGPQQVAKFATRYLPQPDFDTETIRILFLAFRHPIAHRGIASGVWVDQQPGAGLGRRLVWAVSAGTKRPAIQVVAEPGTLMRDPPWDTTYTHRVHVHLGALWRDIAGAIRHYAADVSKDAKLQQRFVACMSRLYPT
jgi:hypothetical protein